MHFDYKTLLSSRILLGISSISQKFDRNPSINMILSRTRQLRWSCFLINRRVPEEGNIYRKNNPPTYKLQRSDIIYLWNCCPYFPEKIIYRSAGAHEIKHNLYKYAASLRLKFCISITKPFCIREYY